MTIIYLTVIYIQGQEIRQMSENIDPNISHNLGRNVESLSHVDPLVLGDNQISSFDITYDMVIGNYILYSWNNQSQQDVEQSVDFQFAHADYCNDPLPICIGNTHCRYALQWFDKLIHHLTNHSNMSVYVYFIHWQNHHGVLVGPIDDITTEQRTYLDEMAQYYGTSDHVSMVEHTLPDYMDI